MSHNQYIRLVERQKRLKLILKEIDEVLSRVKERDCITILKWNKDATATLLKEYRSGVTFEKLAIKHDVGTKTIKDRIKVAIWREGFLK